MFDPTIFDNLKVVLEGELYDRERSGLVVLKNRQDLLDLASFSRAFRMQISLPKFTNCTMELTLASDLQDFAAELKKLHIFDTVPGCQMQVFYRLAEIDIDEKMFHTISCKLFEWWEQEVMLECAQHYSYGWQASPLQNESITKQKSAEFLLIFKQKINEQHIEDLPQLVDHLLQTSEQLQKLLTKLF